MDSFKVVKGQGALSFPLKISSMMVILALLLGLAACAGQPPAPTANALPSQTASPPPSATLAATASLSATSTATDTFTPLPPTLSPTPVPLAERIPIVEYHFTTFRLTDQVMMQTAWFEEQMKWLADNHFTTLSTADVISFLNGGDFPMRSIVLTFDVGTAHRSDFANVIIPTLKQYGLKAIFFLLTNDSVVRDPCGLKEDTFCWTELRQWQDDGVVSFGSHGLYHPDYTTLTADEMRYDAGTAKKIMESKLGQPVLAFTYPYDAVNKTAVAVIRSLGYQFATSGNNRADLSMHRLDADRYELPRLYPYSNPNIYPVLNGSNGKTFPQLIMAALQEYVPTPGAASSTPGMVSPSATTLAQETSTLAVTATAEQTATPTGQAALSATVNGLVDFCIANPQAQGGDWAARLDAQAFPSDLSPTAQTQLPSGVVVHPTCIFAAGNLPRAVVINDSGAATLVEAILAARTAGGASTHYIIDRSGAVIQMVPENLVAFHVSCSGVRSACIPSCPICDRLGGGLVEPYTQSIGIEMINNGKVNPNSFQGSVYEDYMMAFGWRYWEDYSQAQFDALRALVKDIRTRDSIPWDMVMGEYRINYRVDPGPALNLFWPRTGFPPRPPIFDPTQP